MTMLLEKMDPLLTIKDLARLTGRTPRTLQQWRIEHRGPAYVRLSGRRGVRYRQSAVRAWLESLEQVGSHHGG